MKNLVERLNESLVVNELVVTESTVNEAYTKDKYFKICLKYIKDNGDKLYKDYFEWFADVLAGTYREEDMEGDFDYDYLDDDIWNMLDAGSTELYYVGQFIMGETDIYDYFEDDEDNKTVEDLWNNYVRAVADEFGDIDVTKIKTPAFND